MKGLIYAAVLIANTLVQYVFFGRYPIFSVVPDTLLCLVVAVAMLQGFFDGAMFGMAGGLIKDAFFANSMGPNAILYLLIGLGIGMFVHLGSYRKKGILWGVILVFLAGIVSQCAILAINALDGVPFSFNQVFIRDVLPLVALSCLCMVGIYPLMRKIHKNRAMHVHWDKPYR